MGRNLYRDFSIFDVDDLVQIVFSKDRFPKYERFWFGLMQKRNRPDNHGYISSQKLINLVLTWYNEKKILLIEDFFFNFRLLNIHFTYLGIEMPLVIRVILKLSKISIGLYKRNIFVTRISGVISSTSYLFFCLAINLRNFLLDLAFINVRNSKKSETSVLKILCKIYFSTLVSDLYSSLSRNPFFCLSIYEAYTKHDVFVSFLHL